MTTVELIHAGYIRDDSHVGSSISLIRDGEAIVVRPKLIEVFNDWRWMVKDHPRIVANASTLLRQRKHGLAPYAHGLPVLA